MRKLFVVLFLISGLGLTAQDQTEEAGRYSYNLSSMVLSKYYGSIVGGIFYNRPLVFNDLMISRSDKAGSTYVDLWMSRPVTNLDWNRNGGDEYDFVLGRTLDLGKKKVDGQPTVRLDIAGTYLAVYPPDSIQRPRVHGSDPDRFSASSSRATVHCVVPLRQGRAE